MSDLSRLLLASGNPGKLVEIRRALEGVAITLESPADRGLAGWEPPEETGVTYRENALLKAADLAAKAGAPAMADDSGLEVDHLDGAPGVYSARYAATAAARNEKLLAALEGVPDEGRGARFVCVLAIAVPGEEPLYFEGTLEGRIAHAPGGDGGFGYDPVFLLPDRGVTVAEIDPAEKDRISHRGRALAALRAHLAA